MNATVRPLGPDAARRIARAFLPATWLGNRYDYFYVRAKLRSDPLYPGVLAALRGTQAPLLDLGCGLGVLAHALRTDGQAMPYLGVDFDAGKVGRASRAAQVAGLADVDFAVIDLAAIDCPAVDTASAIGEAVGRAGHWPVHAGSVALLDVLQYLPDEAQARVLVRAAAALAPGARLVIRTGLDDATGRGRATRIGDRLGHLVGWMRTAPRHHPTREGLQARLQGLGLAVEFTPLYGDTPFNNWLVVATR